MNKVAVFPNANRYDGIANRNTVAAGGDSPGKATRLQRRFEIIFSGNSDAFRDARVLDLKSSSGVWSLAALDAGAKHVVAVEPGKALIESARKAFSECEIDAASYLFMNSDVPSALRSFEPGAFDLVISHGYFEQSDPRFFFSQMNRLQIKRVLLDTRISLGKGPIVRLRNRSPDEMESKVTNRYNSILSIPNHELVAFFCDYFKFGWRLVLGKTSQISDWAGLSDYEQGRHSTYLLERSAD
jgi:16S rRNA G966 N2-methylase RsmD